MRQKRAVIIGSGIGGIATALRLKNKGYNVSVFEANPYLGGKLHSKNTKGYRFDMGPSLFTLPSLVDELFVLHQKNPRHYFNYKKKETICNYFWEDGTNYSMPASTSEFVQTASNFFGEPVNRIEKYITQNQKKYLATKSIFLEKSLHKLDTYISRETLKSILKIGGLGLFSSLNELNRQTFSNPKLVQVFNRYATYNGSSPYKTPGIMSLIPHLEMGIGTYFPVDGMHSIPKSLVKLAKEVGIDFFLNERVEEILKNNNRAIGIRTINDTYEADLVVSNMDIYPTYKKLLPKEKYPKKVLHQERSSSALIFYWGIKGNFPQLNLHNILFSDNYEEEFDTIFNKRTLYEDPTIYINISSKEKPDDAPPNAENWFVMINAPGDYGQCWATLIPEARKNIIKKLNRILKIDIESLIATELILDPKGIENNTSSYRGALYGAASNSRLAAFLRHANFSNTIESLYFCGGSVHPGGGIPLCLLSAKIVSDLIPNAAK